MNTDPSRTQPRGSTLTPINFLCRDGKTIVFETYMNYGFLIVPLFAFLMSMIGIIRGGLRVFQWHTSRVAHRSTEGYSKVERRIV